MHERPDISEVDDQLTPVQAAAAWGLDWEADAASITPAARKFFGGGQCHALAAACAQQLGAQMIGTSDGRWRVHMGVLIDENHVADIDGIHSRAEWEQHWDSQQTPIFDDGDDAVIWAMSKGSGQSADEISEVYAPMIIDHWSVQAHNLGLTMPGASLER